MSFRISGESTTSAGLGSCRLTGFEAGRQFVESLAGQGVERRRGVEGGIAGEVGQGRFHVFTHLVHQAADERQMFLFVGILHYFCFQVVNVLLGEAGLVAEVESASAFVGEDVVSGPVVGLRAVTLCKVLVDERVDPVLVLLGGYFVGGFEDGEVAVCAGDFGGGGLGLFGANRFHFLVGEAVEVDPYLSAAANDGVVGGAECSFQHPVHAVLQHIHHVFQSRGDAFVESGGGGGVCAAESAPLAGLVGGAVGNAVTVELLETFSVAGRAVAFDTFTGCLRHGYESPGMWGPSIVRPMGRGGWRFDLCRGYSHLHEGMCGVMELLY